MDGLSTSIFLNSNENIVPTLLEISLNMHRAVLQIKMSSVVEISDLNIITITCGEGYVASLDGIFSTPDSNNVTDMIQLRLSPYTFASICCQLLCVESGTVFLHSLTALHDPFGNTINSDLYASFEVRIMLQHFY